MIAWCVLPKNAFFVRLSSHSQLCTQFLTYFLQKSIKNQYNLLLFVLSILLSSVGCFGVQQMINQIDKLFPLLPLKKRTSIIWQLFPWNCWLSATVNINFATFKHFHKMTRWVLLYRFTRFCFTFRKELSKNRILNRNLKKHITAITF